MDRIPRVAADSSRLRPSGSIPLEEIFSRPDIGSDWIRAVDDISEVFAYVDRGGAINPGDRRALFYLIRYFQPRNVLEVGTHVGGSTLHIAAALKAGNGATPKLTTLDIDDVNDERVRLWESHGVREAPRKNIARIGCANMVEFVVASSLDFLADRGPTFDFIFLDGSHDAAIVYREIPLALKALKADGCLLLHDFFPGGKPLWSNGVVIPGPDLAVLRLRHEGAALSPLPLADLPWATKLNSRRTSLALLVKA